ncbi:dehydrogenase domain protein [Mycobacterium avium subsp. avium 2285 (R)]|nr:dehydrogenase domain protein [Mycobacterium avium subsp. avium 2285 (R)]
MFAVLMKGVVDILEHNPGQLWRSFELYALVFCGVAGMIYHQSAYRAGALTASLPTIIVAKPVVGGILGIIVLRETLVAGGWEWVVLAVTAVVVIVATVGLAAVRPRPCRPAPAGRAADRPAQGGLPGLTAYGLMVLSPTWRPHTYSSA